MFYNFQMNRLDKDYFPPDQLSQTIKLQVLMKDVYNNFLWGQVEYLCTETDLKYTSFKVTQLPNIKLLPPFPKIQAFYLIFNMLERTWPSIMFCCSSAVIFIRHPSLVWAHLRWIQFIG